MRRRQFILRKLDYLKFAYGLLANGEIWMDMIKSRNQTSHTYNEETADEIVHAIKENYLDEFLVLQQRLNTLKDKNID